MVRETEDIFKHWAVLELMGHRRLAGLVQEQTIAGAAFIRIDVPELSDTAEPDAEVEQWTTQLYSPGAVYCITPCSREAAMIAARRNSVDVVHPWEIRQAALAAPADRHDSPYTDHEEEDGHIPAEPYSIYDPDYPEEGSW